MPVPAEYQRATDDFYAFLVDARDASGLGSTHQAFTMTPGVLRAFRMRMSVPDAIRFADVLPAGLQALFVSAWGPEAPPVECGDRRAQMADVRAVRADHNLSTDDAIEVVAAGLVRAADETMLRACSQRCPRAPRSSGGSRPTPSGIQPRHRADAAR